MNSNLIKTYNNGPSDPEWHSWRFKNGLGASQVPCVCGLTPQWKSPIQLFYELLDFRQWQNNDDNFRMSFGSRIESTVCDYYRYWDGTRAGMLKNERNGTIVNEISKVNAFIQNPKYPWLFCSLDSRIHKNGQKGEGLLEAKSISGWVAQKYIDDLPPYQLMQVQTGLLITELEYGDLAVLTDVYDFGVYSFNPNIGIQDSIIPITKIFWGNVLKARIVKTQMHEATINHNMRLWQELKAELVSLEPPLIGGEAEALFLKEQYKIDKNIGQIKGTDEDYQLALHHKELKAQISELTEKAMKAQNTLMKRIGDNTALDFGKQGKVSWQGNPRKFSNKIKI